VTESIHFTQVTVARQDLLDVLAAVPGWVPEGSPGDNLWDEASLEAKNRLLRILDAE
jgi:hypothetical protein